MEAGQDELHESIVDMQSLVQQHAGQVTDKCSELLVGASLAASGRNKPFQLGRPS